jgi:hypothetical protein
MKKTSILFFTIILLIPLFSGCATLFGPDKHPLDLSSNPQGAEVIVNGVKKGTTPLELELKADKSYTIEFKKEGYQKVTRVVNTEVGAGWVVLDVLGGLVPVIVDAATGNWNKLDQEAVNASLSEEN